MVEEIRSDQTVLIGSFTQTPPIPRSALEVEDMIFPRPGARPRETLADYVRAISPAVNVEVELPGLDGKAGEKPAKVVLTVPFGGALLTGAQVEPEDEARALLASFDADAVAYNAADENDENPLLRMAVALATCRQMQEGGELASLLDEKKSAKRLEAVKEKLSQNTRTVPIPGAAEVILPAVDDNRTERAFSAMEHPGVSAAMTKAKLAALRFETANALVAAAPEADCDAYLQKRLSDIEAGLKTAINEIGAAQKILQRNWVSLALAHGAAPDGAAPRVLNVPEGWMTSPVSRLRAPGGQGTGAIAQEQAFEDAIISMQDTDMSKAAMFAVLLDGVKTPAELQRVGEWAHRNFVTLIACSDAQDAEELAETMGSTEYRKNKELWKQNVHFVAGDFSIARAPEGSLTLPLSAIVAARQIRLANRKLARGDTEAATGVAVPVSGQSVALLGGDGGDGPLVKMLTERDARPLFRFNRMDSAKSYGAELVDLPLVRDGDTGVFMGGAKSQYKSDPDRPANKPFEFISAVNVRNFIVRSIARHVKRHYQGRAMDDSAKKELEKEIKAFLKSCGGEAQSGRRLIDPKNSQATVVLRADNQLDISLSLSFIPIADTIGIEAMAAVEEITMKKNGEEWVMQETVSHSDAVETIT